MIEIKMNELLSSMPVLKTLSTESFSVKTAFQIARIWREAQKENELFETQRNELIKKYCNYKDGQMEFDEQGYIKFEPDNLHKVEAEINELLETSVHLNVEPLSAIDFGDYKMLPDDAAKLIPFMG